MNRLLRDWLEIRRYGVLVFVGFLFDKIRVRRAERHESFDAHYGTDTESVVYPWNLPSIAGERSAEIHPYEGTPARLVRKILNSIPMVLRTHVFIDLGCGKGRTLLVASEFPFAKIIGVEISRELCEIAQRNVNLYRSTHRQCTTFVLFCMDAGEFKFEDQDPLVLFLFNPFGKGTLRRVISNLEMSMRAAQRDGYIVCVNPIAAGALRKLNWLTKFRTGGAWWQPWARYVVYRINQESLRSSARPSQGGVSL